MDEDATREGGLRPYSQPLMPSRFLSLRRLNNAESYRHRSLPADSASPGDDERPDSEITFAVLNDDAPDYDFGPFSDEASLGSGGRRGSASSLAPSFRTRDSRVPSIHHYDSDHIDNQRLLAEGYLSDDMDHSREASMSQETLAINILNPLGKNDSRLAVDRKALPPRSPSRQSWCTCDDGDDHHHAFRPGGPGGSKPKDPNVVCLYHSSIFYFHLLMPHRSLLMAPKTPTIPRTGPAESAGQQPT
jgi:hypothetical protein